MSKTTIDWTQEVWNPIHGCSRGCSYCYARKWALRHKAIGTKGYEHGFKPFFDESRLDQPQHWRKPRRVFVGSMGDIMDPAFHSDDIRQIIDRTLCTDRHTYIFLTKRPERLADFNPWPDNCWVGATATDQAMADEALRQLNNVEAKVRFLSCEPLTSAMWLPLSTYPVEWLIVGAMTGAKPRRPKDEVFADLVCDTRTYHIPVFVKNNVPWTGKRPQEFPV